MKFDFQVRVWKWSICVTLNLLDIDPSDRNLSFGIEISW